MHDNDTSSPRIPLEQLLQVATDLYQNPDSSPLFSRKRHFFLVKRYNEQHVIACILVLDRKKLFFYRDFATKLKEYTDDRMA